MNDNAGIPLITAKCCLFEKKMNKNRSSLPRPGHKTLKLFILLLGSLKKTLNIGIRSVYFDYLFACRHCKSQTKHNNNHELIHYCIISKIIIAPSFWLVFGFTSPNVVTTQQLLFNHCVAMARLNNRPCANKVCHQYKKAIIELWFSNA